MTQHIVSGFDRDLEAIQAQVMRMGGLVEAALLDAARALEERDEDLALRVRDGDAVIDQLDEAIRADCALLIARRAPAAMDLRTVLSVMKIAAALERAGDYAKNLAKRALVLGQMPAVGATAASVRRLAKSVVVMLKDALDAFATRDVALALDVRGRDREVDQMYNSIFREVLDHMTQDPRTITAAMHLHFIAKNIERVGDHATAIAEQVVYLVTGALPDGDRPKVAVIG